MLYISLNVSLAEKQPKAINTRQFISFLAVACVLRIADQSTIRLSNIKDVKNITEIMDMSAYEVDINFKANFLLPFARALLKLFLNPWPIPKSKDSNHITIENKMSHVPYFDWPRYESTNGMSTIPVPTLMLLRMKVKTIFFFAFLLLVFPLLGED